ncbi:GNAT family N-acetyltransferase [Lachnospiraceae bacterium MD1]|uniref:GNAT family N-acetyltransferase n=1 Tax=Variimorphobacter saccharofermentans TaxID=2755051 RepID=A0A839K3J8_9FIRM|nr:GNAT family protein [Variimorphobacter saccharofermentans]MBB2184190.1 GNAT family N-acetyltransferase [Variimorphobacter saccharofermentans]
MKDCYLKSVQLEDKKLLYKWANDEETRLNSFSTDFIPYETHEKWFNNVIRSEDILQFIYYMDNIPIGQVRLSINNNIAYINYSISKDHRGKGHGKNILLLVEKKLRDEYPYITQINAQVKVDNVPSRKIFEGLNYNQMYIEYSKKI